MKRKIEILAIVLFGILVFAAVPVHAEEEKDAAAVYAYAILQDNGELVFFNSTNQYTDYTNYTSVGPAVDVNGNKYVGMIAAFTNGFKAYDLQSNKGTNITSIQVAPGQKVMAPASMDSMFESLEYLKNASFKGLDTSNVTSMDGMFRHCNSLTSLDISTLDTSNVMYMAYMFTGCSSLTSLDLSSFDTSNVKWMGMMFWNCSSLTSLDLSSFDTSNLTIMTFMFCGCSSLTSLDVSRFDTSNVTSMGKAFSNCSSLKELDVSSFDTSNVQNMHGMFYGCSSLTSLDLTTFDTSNVTDMYQAFAYCSSIKELNVSSFDTSKVTTMYGMFEHCSSLTSLDLSSFDTSNVNEMYWLVRGCTSLVSLDLSSFDTSKVSNMEFMFGLDDEKSTSYLRNLRHVKLGPGFTNWINEATLPSVGVWTNEKLNLKKTARELYEEYPSRAAEWAGTWEIIGANALPFIDVPENKYFYAPVRWAYYHIPQITSGVDDTHFGPDLTCTRAQVVTFLWRANGCPEPKTKINPFKDVKSTAYYYKAVLWAVENGITTGIEDTKFGPNAGCTRGQVVTFMYRANGEPQIMTTKNPFKDVKKSAYYYKAVLWAYENDITSGTSKTTFSPNDTCTRGQIVTFLFRNYNE